MSRETMEWLNTNTLIGYTEKRGNAWHYRKGLQGAEPNHFTGPVPMERVRRLFDYEALSVPVSYTLPDGREFTDDTRRVIAHSRTGEAFGVFRDSYVPHQLSEWLIGVTSTLLDADLAIGSAGLLMSGAVAWLQVEMEDTISTREGFDFRSFIMANTSFNGKFATQYTAGNQAVVCDNTLDMALTDKGRKSYKVKHTRNSGLKIMDAREALSIIHADSESFAEDVARLSAVKVTARQFGKFLDLWSPIPDPKTDPSKAAVTFAEGRREKLTEIYKSDPMACTWKGTGLGVIQAVNTYGQHHNRIKGAGRGAEQGPARFDRSILALMDGTLTKVTADAVAKLAAVTGADLN